MHPMRTVGIVALGILAFGPALADTVTLIASRDNTLYESAAGELSNGSGPTMFCGRTNQGVDDRRRAVVMFDVAGAVPPGATINGATLKLFMSQTVVGAERVTLHRVLSSWGEGISNAGPAGGSGAASETNDATWIHRFYSSTTWGSAGGDFTGVVSASATVTGLGFYSWSSPTVVADVQGWLGAPASNFGWLVLGNEDATPTSKRFNTRENTSLTTRPQLVIQYTPQSIPVEPVTWSRIKALY